MLKSVTDFVVWLFSLCKFVNKFVYTISLNFFYNFFKFFLFTNLTFKRTPVFHLIKNSVVPSFVKTSLISLSFSAHTISTSFRSTVSCMNDICLLSIVSSEYFCAMYSIMEAFVVSISSQHLMNLWQYGLTQIVINCCKMLHNTHLIMLMCFLLVLT